MAVQRSPALGQSFILHVPVPVLIALVLFVGAAVVAAKTPFGRHVYAVGGNERASRLSGIRVDSRQVSRLSIFRVLRRPGGLDHCV
jgi:ribose/xylose/arabinose/galactoside ABC-type transport system permease subunit